MFRLSKNLEHMSDRMSVILDSDVKIRVSRIENVVGNSEDAFLKHIEDFRPCLEEIQGLEFDKVKSLRHLLNNLNYETSAKDVSSCLINEPSGRCLDYIDEVVTSYAKLKIGSTDDQKVQFSKEVLFLEDHKVSREGISALTFDIDTCANELTKQIDLDKIVELGDLISHSHLNNSLICFMFQKPIILIFGIKGMITMYESYFSINFNSILTKIKKRMVYAYNQRYQRYVMLEKTVIRGVCLTSAATFIFSIIKFGGQENKVKIDIDKQSVVKFVETISQASDKFVPEGFNKIILDGVEKAVGQISYSVGTVSKAAFSGIYASAFKPILEIVEYILQNKK